MSLLNLKIKIENRSWRKSTIYERWEVFTILLFGFLTASVILGAYFTYTYVYRTLDDAHSIIVLSSSASINQINETFFQNAAHLVALKNSSSTFAFPIRDIFSYASSTNASTPASSTSSSKNTP